MRENILEQEREDQKEEQEREDQKESRESKTENWKNKRALRLQISMLILLIVKMQHPKLSDLTISDITIKIRSSGSKNKNSIQEWVKASYGGVFDVSSLSDMTPFCSTGENWANSTNPNMKN